MNTQTMGRFDMTLRYILTILCNCLITKEFQRRTSLCNLSLRFIFLHLIFSMHTVNRMETIIATKWPLLTRCAELQSGGRLFTSSGVKLARSATLKKYYQTLGVAEDCEDEILRLAFVHLAKQFHPDSSGSSDADAAKFSEVENAYREIQRERIAQREREMLFPTGVKEFDIRHTAPQHRNFLQYDTGIGTPSERQRRHTAERAQKAAENVMEHRLKTIQAAERNSLIGMDKSRARDAKTRCGIDRLVEDLIQEAMRKGEFSDLPGAGKPLADYSSSQNPYVDFVTHKMNQILMDNGFTPQWIQLSKEIRLDTRSIEEELGNAREKLGSTPLSFEDSRIWHDTVEQLRVRVKRINTQIDKYNLLVPILQKQMLHVDLDVLANRALATRDK